MRAIFVFFGGQRQWARLALALAQGAPVPLLDEPTTFLDPAHAISVLELVRKQARAGKTVVVVLHDHMLAGQYSDTRAVMNNGEVIARGDSQGSTAEGYFSRSLRYRCRNLGRSFQRRPPPSFPVLCSRARAFER